MSNSEVAAETAMRILQAAKGAWVCPSAYPNVPWQTFRAVIRSQPNGEWRYGVSNRAASCRLREKMS